MMIRPGGGLILFGLYYWPESAPHLETFAAFIAASSTRGYAPCADGDFEVG
jgi:hypothetical protein